MMARQIGIFIVDDMQETINNIKQLIAMQQDLTVVGEAASAEALLTNLPGLSVDVVLMDVNMGGIDGIRATEKLREQYPDLVVILMSVQQEPEYFRRAMLAGAHNYLVKPFSSSELASTIKDTLERQRRLQPPLPEGKVIAVFSTKGGVGKTTLAVNLSVALKQRHPNDSVALVDGALSFGDVALFVNLQPRWTLYDAAKDGRNAPGLWDERMLLLGPAGVNVLPAPVRPEQAEDVSVDVLLAAIKFIKSKSSYAVIDLEPLFNERVLAALELADLVLLVGTLDLPSVKNVRLALDTMERVGIGQDKIKVVLNRVNSEGALDKNLALKTINHQVIAELPSDGKCVMNALNKGVPFIIDSPTAEISRAVNRLAEAIDAGAEAGTSQSSSPKKGWKRFWGGE